ncbi:MAG: 3'-5' exonuclease [Reyranella sp.]|nr:3'-5' exonuclease [Reyranella sp.]
MEFRIADTFTDSLGRLAVDEQKAVKTTAFDLQVNPAHPSLQFHKLDRPKDPNFASVRVSKDIRIIVHRTSGSLLLCYVDHHDEAYRWAERRRIETHPKTGAAQLVEVRETVKEIAVPKYVEVEQPSAARAMSLLFAQFDDDRLLGYGVPPEWLADVKGATEDSLLELADHLPAEAAEALLELATGGTPIEFKAPPAGIDPFNHPDAQRRFRTMHDGQELQRALDYPWEKWTVFLHPAQEQLVRTAFNGPARVSGSAGTGKTIVALHRAAWLARGNRNARVLLATFSDPLANALQTRLRRLLGDEPRLGERMDVRSLDAIGLRLYKAHLGDPKLASREDIRTALKAASDAVLGHKFGAHFLLTEWEQVVDAWQLDGWEAYRDVARLGRKTRLPEAQRKVLWSIFDKVRAALAASGLTTRAQMFTTLAAALGKAGKTPFEFIVIDEAQDLSVAQLRFLAAMGSGRKDALFFAGDLGQRIFQLPFSWKALGVDIRGRSRTLKVNYRTSHQIRTQADRLLGPVVSDVDGNDEDRKHTVSVFNGPPPVVRAVKDEAAESQAVAAWIGEQITAGILPHEFGVFVRSEAQLDRARAALGAAGLPFKVLDDRVETASGLVSISTMHLAKGLEFRAVVVMACDDEVIPLQARIEAVGDDADLQEVYDTERHLLYVACTRARDHLLVTGVDPVSEFLDDLSPSSKM